MPTSLPTSFRVDDIFASFSPHTPRPWINYLGNRRLKAFVSNQGGGVLWWHEPTTRRLTRYHYTAPPGDRPGFYVYVKDGRDGSVWNPHFAPTCLDLDDFVCRHEPGITSFEGMRNGLRVGLELTIPPADDVLVWRLRATNATGGPIQCELATYMEFGLLEFLREAMGWCYLQSHFALSYDEKLRAIRYDYHVFEAPHCPKMLVGGDVAPDGFECSRDVFIGRTGSLDRPAGMARGLRNSELPNGGHACGVLGFQLDLPAGGSSERVVVFALGETWEEAANRLETYRTPVAAEAAFAATRAFWKKRLGRFCLEGADPVETAFAQTWIPYNALVAADNCRIISTDHMGTDGLRYRDTMQDALAAAESDPDFCGGLLESILSVQAADGEGCFNFYPGGNPAPSVHPQRSDNTVWPVWTLKALISETGNWDLLGKQLPFRDGGRATVYEHVLLGLRWISQRLGPNGLPRMLHADWNDGLAVFGDEKAESVMLGMQLVAAASEFAKISRRLDRREDAEEMDALAAGLRGVLNSDLVWDGAWYRRLILSNGHPVGSSSNRQGSIYLEPQVWAVMSGVGEFADRGRKAMDSVHERLGTAAGLAILTPAYRGFPEPEDPPRGSSPGTNENGAVFCHANTWAIIADAILGNSSRAWESFRRLLPTSLHQRFGTAHYEREPYVFVSSIAGTDSAAHGRGGISWLTGTASWMQVALHQYLFGVRPDFDELLIDPRLSHEETLTIHRTWRGRELQIEIRGGGIMVSEQGRVIASGDGPLRIS